MTKLAYLQDADGYVIATSNPQYHQGLKALPAATGKRLYRQQVIDQLKRDLKPGDKVYTILRHVSASGAACRISLVIPYVHQTDQTGIVTLDYSAALAIDAKLHPKGGIIINGCGMDMGFELVYRLGSALWPNGTDEPHGTRNGEPDRESGYALKHQWL